MRWLRRCVLLVGMGLAVGLTPLGCSNAGSGSEKRIILLTNGNSPFWDAGRAGMQEAEKDLRLHEAGLSAVFEVNNGQPQGQIDKLRQFATQSDVAAVCISAGDSADQRVAEVMR